MTEVSIDIIKANDWNCDGLIDPTTADVKAYRHCSPSVKARQERLESAVQKTWDEPKLLL